MKKLLTITLLALTCLNLYPSIEYNEALNTELFAAVHDANLTKVQSLLTNQANPNAIDHQGLTPLLIASMKSYLKTAALLINSGAHVNGDNHFHITPLLMAITNHDTEMVELLIKNGANPNQPAAIRTWPPLHMAAFYGHPKITKLLLTAGANPNLTTQNGLTPLAIATFPENRHDLKYIDQNYLAEQGANLHSEVEKLLSDAGAQLDLNPDPQLKTFLKIEELAITASAIISVTTAAILYYLNYPQTLFLIQ